VPAAPVSWAVLVAGGPVVGGVARVGATVQVDGRLVGREAERLEAEPDQRVVDRVERHRRLHRTSTDVPWAPPQELGDREVLEKMRATTQK